MVRPNPEIVSKAMEKVPMTVEGFQMIEAELHRLKAEERPRIIQQISDAREHGDLSENAEYHAAKEAQGLNEARVAELEDKVGRAEVIDHVQAVGHHRQVRRDRDADGRGFRRQGQIQDRRRARGRREERQDFGQFADCPRPDRQVQGRKHRGHHAARRAQLRDPQDRIQVALHSALASPGSFRCSGFRRADTVVGHEVAGMTATLRARSGAPGRRRSARRART